MIFFILVFSPWLSSDADETLYGETGIWVKGSTDVVGDISVGGDIIIGRDSLIQGSIRAIGDVLLQRNTIVEGDVEAGGTVYEELGVSVSGTVTEGSVAIPEYDIPTSTFTPGFTSVSVPAGGSTTLDEGNYRTITVGRNGNLILTGGTYQARTLRVNQNATVTIQAPVILILDQYFLFMSGSRVEYSDTGATSSDFEIYTLGTTDSIFTYTDILDFLPTFQAHITAGIATHSKFYRNSVFKGVIHVPYGLLELESGVQITGKLEANEMIISTGVTICGKASYLDVDGDTYGDATVISEECEIPDGYVLQAGDCNDGDAAIKPGAEDICGDGIDQDCSGEDLGCGVDEDGDGFTPLEGDCNDENAAIHPDAQEICDELDNDCDDLIDDDDDSTDAATKTSWYVDADDDHYGVGSVVSTSCVEPANRTNNNEDCDDASAEIHPSAEEVCDGNDNNCSGTSDEDLAFCSGGVQGTPPNPEDIAPQINRTVSTVMSESVKFLYDSGDPVQVNVDETQIEDKRLSTMRGQVLDQSGSALYGVQISIKDHDEFGQTVSQTSGAFDMSVNGGSTLTLLFKKPGYLPARRQVFVPWQRFVKVPDVVMVPMDSSTTAINLSAPARIQRARSSLVSDTHGDRTATILFPRTTQATMQLTDGREVELTDLNVHITEYTVGDSGPDAMPAPLPANSAYTYAIELTVDEAEDANTQNVTFSEPIVYYVENFLNFPVGEVVPVGYFDETLGQWVASDNGVIIEVLGDEDGDAITEIDIDGDGVAENETVLTEYSVTMEEREELTSLYTTGQTLWRVLIPHFSTWDFNWPTGLPGDAVSPSQPVANSDETELDPCLQSGSIIECENQILGEDENITGSDFGLHYRSDRVPGRASNYTLNIPLTGREISDSLTAVDIIVEVGGEAFTERLAASADLNYDFEWDGVDAYGREVQGPQPVFITIGYVYTATYQSTPSFGSNGNGTAIPSATARDEAILWQRYETSIGNWDQRELGLGGWSLGIHHVYDPISKVLYLGDGRKQGASDIQYVINTVAGTGSTGYWTGEDNNPATEARLYNPYGVSVDDAGNLYIADTRNNRIRKVDSSGIITTVAGDGNIDYYASDDGQRATSANIYRPYDIDFDNSNNMYIAGTYHNRIYKVDSAGTFHHFAGGGSSGYGSGYFADDDGGPAIDAQLGGPLSMVADNAGNVYIADTLNSRIRKVDSAGIINTIAGGSGIYEDCTTCGDGGLAVDADIAYPGSIIIDHDGNIVFSDYSIDRIRKIDPYGIITGVAGTTQGYSGDGGLATYAMLNWPQGIDMDQEGNIFIADRNNNVIRKITADGVIQTMVGTGTAGFSGDGGPASEAEIDSPSDVTVDQEGNIYIADTDNNRVRKISSLFPGFTNSDIIIPSEEGTELYHFDAVGRHLETTNALTNSVLYEFTYDEDGLLSSITDGNGRVTAVSRADDTHVNIISPDGFTTNLELNADGYLQKITNPESEETQFAYDTGEGLLTSRIDPLLNTTSYTYDADTGRLTREDDAAGGFKALARTDSEDGSYQVNLTTGEGRGYEYYVSRPDSGDASKEYTDANGLIYQTTISDDGSEQITRADGVVIASEEGPDPRYGMQAPILENLTITTPLGLEFVSQKTSTVTLLDSSDLTSLIDKTDTTTVNGRTHTSLYTAATLDFLNTSPELRQSRVVIDTLGRITESQLASLDPTTFEYTDGFLTAVEQVDATNTRRTEFSYYEDGHAWEGFLKNMTDSLSQVTTFEYDSAGRITKKILPDLREIAYTYDDNGNLESITPPGKPVHSFDYTAANILDLYIPPDIALANHNTSYDYNLDKQIDLITRPDGKTIDYVYETGKTRLDNLILSDRGTVDYAYLPFTEGGTPTDNNGAGNLSAITTPEGNAIAYTYDGSLLKTQTWSGEVTGSVENNYDNNFWITSRIVNSADEISYSYDNDGLITSVEDMSVVRVTDTGFEDTTSLGAVTTDADYNAFGELQTFTASVSGTAVYLATYTYDVLGRIDDVTQTISGTATVNDYDYESFTGRLDTVTVDGTLAQDYSYDENGNRDGGTYDDQDRLLIYGTDSYTYTDNGELYTKVDADGTTIYTYDVLGNLTQVILPDGTQIDYIIDGQNRRVGKKVNGTLAQGFLYQDQLNPIVELDGSNNIVSRFVYGTKANVPDYMIKSGVTYRIISDHLGSPRLVINTSDGSIAQQISYDDFGNITSDSNPGFQPFGFAGGLYDTQTRLVRFGARDYDAEVGRWTAKDPILFNGGDTNLYGYVMNDPVNWIDSLGLKVYVCNRKTTWGMGNHAYIWNDQTNEGYGIQGSSISWNGHPPENGPSSDTCIAVEGSEGNEDKMMEYLKKNADNGLWVPFINDCHDAVEDAVESSGFEYPGAPGGRFGEPR